MAQPGTDGSYGTFAIDAAGAWTYTASSAHNEFVAGTTYTDTFTVAASDGTHTSVTVNILGSDDVAVLSSATSNLTETDAVLSTGGTLTLSDPDGATTFVAQPGTDGSYGTFAIDAAGAWTYTASSAHNEFVAGTTYTDTFTVAASDGTHTSVTVNILGSDDVAVLSSATSNLTETDAVLSTGGTLTLSDPDGATTFVAQPWHGRQLRHVRDRRGRGVRPTRRARRTTSSLPAPPIPTRFTVAASRRHHHLGDRQHPRQRRCGGVSQARRHRT